MKPQKFLGWTDKQWAASVMASLYGGPGLIALFYGAWGVGIGFLFAACFLFWALSTAGERKRKRL